ncbi:type VI secretion system ATPase TssH [Azospirillum argentinense]|uniref:Type VI secretion system ATPase TssH n=1 Tax=Azospirillum brasilense TaxID=192 RepID=A0A4D8QDH6_AZOBR|nr:type VI secretion system ATPase TssH [Azospirillum argentinense]QCO06220.1 type VI secretion system ATPase TssH [Azospirillum argentinense]
MVSVNLSSLLAKLNEPCRTALEAAPGFALSRGNQAVEIEHWLLRLLDQPDTDLHAIAHHHAIDIGRVQDSLTRSLDGMRAGNTRTPVLSPYLVSLAREGWLLASLDGEAPRVRSGHLLLALLSDETLAQATRAALGPLAKLSAEALAADWHGIAGNSREARQAPAPGASPKVEDTPAAAGGALARFTIDLTERARAGRIDPVLGRDAEIRAIVDVLTRRRQNNPILTGEAGVGKTAVVEGFAARVAAGDVPPALREVAVKTLDLGLLQAGASVRGEFENRLRSVIDEVKASPQPIILFIDEAHTLIGAGGQAGQNDAANLLKPALARGELRTIAATTWAEYKKYFERDPALSRRFQVVKVEEPDEAAALSMMHGLVATLEKHHGVRILDEAVVEAVRLSHRYIAGRQLPDKAVSLLDTACARVGMSQSATPAAVEDQRRTIDALANRIAVLDRETALGTDHAAAIAELTERREAAIAALAAVEARWARELELAAEITRLRDAIEAAEPNSPQAAEGKAALAWTLDELAEAQGEQPLVHVFVDGTAVADVVATWTGIPVGRMVTSEIDAVLSLRERLSERVIGQDHALEAIAQAVRTARARLTDPRKPIGVFLMVGTSGVGKTETALALAEALYGGEQNLTVINMSEFKEEHKVSMLLGSPPGYVGFGEGGVLTEAVRRRPYSVILLDEMEKAHPGVQDIFFQVFDKGMLRDGEGRDIDFKNTLIIMTSNAGTDTLTRLSASPTGLPAPDTLPEALQPELLRHFKPAFLGRVTLVPYLPLAPDILTRIVELNLNRISRRLREAYRADFRYGPEVVEAIAARCGEVHSGARNIEHILTRGLLPDLSALLLERLARDEAVAAAQVGLDAQGRFSFDIH